MWLNVDVYTLSRVLLLIGLFCFGNMEQGFWKVLELTLGHHTEAGLVITLEGRAEDLEGVIVLVFIDETIAVSFWKALNYFLCSIW